MDAFASGNINPFLNQAISPSTLERLLDRRYVFSIVETMIEARNLTKSFQDFVAVRDISFQIDKGSGITGLLGPNGAGKTTTMRLLTGYYQPNSGEVEIAGVKLKDESTKLEIKQKVGYLPESSALYPEMLVSEYLAFIGEVRGIMGKKLRDKCDEMTEKLELGSHLYSPIGILSKGYKQRVALAGTLIHDPEVIILDEPTSGLDPNQITQIRALIRSLAQKCTVVLSTHILQEVEDVCDRVIIISRGKVVADQKTSSLRQRMGYSLIAKGVDVAKLNSSGLLNGVEEAKTADLPDGYANYLCNLKEDNGEKLFSFVAQQGWEVKEFVRLTRSLEDIFRELTNV